MPRVPTIDQITPVDARPQDPTRVQRALGEVSRVAGAAQQLAQQQQDANDRLRIEEDKATAIGQLNDLRLEMVNADPLTAADTFSERANEITRDFLDNAPNDRVRNTLSIEIPAQVESRRFSVAADANKRFFANGKATLQEQVFPNHIRSIVSAQSDVERDEGFQALAESIQASPFHSDAEKQELQRKAGAVAQEQVIRAAIGDARESGDLGEFDVASEMLADDDNTNRLDETRLRELRNVLESERRVTREEASSGLRLELHDAIQSSTTDGDLNEVSARSRQLFEDDLLSEGQVIAFDNLIAGRRKQLVDSGQSFALVQTAIDTGTNLDHTWSEHRKAVDSYYADIVQPQLLADAESGERSLQELVFRTQVIPKQVASDLRRAANSSSSELAAVASERYEKLRQTAPAAAAAMMSDPSFETLRLMHDGLTANEDPGATFKRIREVQQLSKGTRELRVARLGDLRREPGNSDAEWLAENADGLALEVPGWFNDLDFEGEFPSEFQSRYSQLVEQIYTTSEDIGFARKTALERMLVTWGVTGVGANAGRPVPLAPEKMYPEFGNDPEALNEQLLEDLRSDASGIVPPSPAFSVGGQAGTAARAEVREAIDLAERTRRALDAVEDDAQREQLQGELRNLETQIANFSPEVQPALPLTAGDIDLSDPEILSRILLKTDINSGRELNRETGRLTPGYVAYLVDEEGRNPQLLWARDGRPFRWTPDFASSARGRKAQEEAAEKRVEAQRTHKALLEFRRRSPRPHADNVPEILAERGFGSL